MNVFREYFIHALKGIHSHIYQPPGYSGFFIKNDDGIAYAYFNQANSAHCCIPEKYIMVLIKVHQLFHNIKEGYIKPHGLLTFTTQDPAILSQKAQKSKRISTEDSIEFKKGVGAAKFNSKTTSSNIHDQDDVPDEIMINCFNLSKPMYLIALLRIMKCKILTSPLYELPLFAPDSVEKLQEIIIQKYGPLRDIDAIKKYALRMEDFLIYQEEILLPSKIHYKPHVVLIGPYILPKARPVTNLETWLWAAVLRALYDKSSIQSIKKHFLTDFWKQIQDKQLTATLLKFFSNCLSEFYPLIKDQFSFDDFAEVILKLFDPAAVFPSSSVFHNRPLFQVIGKNISNPSDLFDINSPEDWHFSSIPIFQPKMFYYDDTMFMGMCIQNNITVCRVSSYENADSFWKEEFSQQKKTIAQLMKKRIIPAKVYRMITLHDTSNPFIATCRLVRPFLDPMCEELFTVLLLHYPQDDRQIIIADYQFIENQIIASEVDLHLLAEHVQIGIYTKLIHLRKPYITRLFSITDTAWLYYNNRNTFVILGDKESVSNSSPLLGFLNNLAVKVNHVWNTVTSPTFFNTALCLQMAIDMLIANITDYRELIRQTIAPPVWDLVHVGVEYMLKNTLSISNIRTISNLPGLTTHFLAKIKCSTFPAILANIFLEVYYDKFLNSSQGDMALQFLLSKECNVVPIPDGYILRDKCDQICFIPYNLENASDSCISLLREGITDENVADTVLATQKGFHIRLFVKILYDMRPAFFTHQRLNKFSFWANLYDEKYTDLILHVGDISSTIESIIKDPKSVCGYDGEFVSHFVSRMCQEKPACQVIYEQTSLYCDTNNQLLLVIPDLSGKSGLKQLSDSLMLCLLTNMDIAFRYFINDDNSNDVSFVMVHSSEMKINEILWSCYQQSFLSGLNILNMFEIQMQDVQNKFNLHEPDTSSVCFLLYSNQVKKLHDKMINFYRQYYNTSNIHRFLSNNSSSWGKNILSSSLIPALRLYIPSVESVYPSKSQRVLTTESKESFYQLFKHDRHGK